MTAKNARRRVERQLRPGDSVRVRFGHRVIEGTVTSIRGDRVHVTLEIEGSDEPVDGLYLTSELLSA
ncbi:hypothetical protein ACWEKT_18800 [Nocardia takedensis]